MNAISVFWFRRDLRLHDNCGLYNALKSGNKIMPIFIFDKHILENLPQNDLRINIIYKMLLILNQDLKAYNSCLTIYFGDPLEIYKEILTSLNIDSLYFNIDYEPYATKRDNSIKDLFSSCGKKVFSFQDQVIFHENDILKNDGKPYHIYTPYSNKWIENFEELKFIPYQILDHCSNFLTFDYKPLPPLEQLGFIMNNIEYSPPTIPTDIIQNYHHTRNFLNENSTSQISVHLRFGTISIREISSVAAKLNNVFLKELIWREFFMMIIYHYPTVVDQNFSSKHNLLLWSTDMEQFSKWANGKTGFPIIDAAMTQLNQTGKMPNRLRMICAHFLTKLLLIDWRLGEHYFGQKLLDYDLAINNGNWQWAAGTGCDAAPYFRFFNPTLQQQKYDPQEEYIKKWLPKNYNSTPMIDYLNAKTNSLKFYKQIYEK